VRAFAAVVALLLPVTAAFPVTPDRHLTQYGHRSWRYQDYGLAGKLVNGLAQTTDGYLWIGTQQGLWRFDGVRFVQPEFPPGESLPSLDIISLAAARDGSLWLGTGSGLVRLYRGHLRVYSQTTRRIDDVAEGPDGSIWFAPFNFGDNEQSLCRIAGDRFQCFGPREGVVNTLVAHMLVAPNGDVWLGCDTLAERWSPRSASIYAFPELRKNSGQDGVSGLAISHDGSIWIGTFPNLPGPGLLRIVDGKPVPYRPRNLDTNKLTASTVYVDHADVLWVGVTDDGLYRIIGDTAEHFGIVEGLSSATARKMLEDQEGTLWVATDEGLDAFYDTRVVEFSRREGVGRGGEVDGVQASRAGTVLIGTARGLQILRTKDSSVHIDTHLSQTQIDAMFEDRARRLWIGVDDDLYVEREQGVSRVTASNGQPLGMIYDLTEDGAGDLWAYSRKKSGDRQLIRIHDTDAVQLYPASEVPVVRSLVGDPTGGVWLGLRSGDLAHFDGHDLKVTAFRHDNTAVTHRIILTRDQAVLGATSYGMIGLRGAERRTLDRKNGLPCMDVYAIVPDLPGNLWLPSQCGLIEIPAGELAKWWSQPRAQLAVRLFDSTDGMHPGVAPFGSAARSTDGRIWIANGQILQMVDPSHLVGNTVAPPVHIEQIWADRRAYLPGDGLRLPALTRDIQIDYTALSFIAPQKVRFRYHLEGHDDRWVDPDNRRQAFYNDLPPGDYTFRVIASNNDGLWNRTGASLSFTIMPAFYQTVWFRALLAVLAISILWLLYVLRIRRATAQVQSRLGARLAERERIARELHDTLLQGFQGLILKFQAVLKQLSHPEVARSMMEAALDRADEVLREGRMRVRDLRSEENTSMDLAAMLEQFGQSFASQSSAAFKVTTAGVRRALNPICKEELFRIGREAVANAFLHAAASRIEVDVIYGHHHFELGVIDDGKGIPQQILQSGRADHWGLTSMREGARRIGAELTIKNNHDAGARVTLSITSKLCYPSPDDRSTRTRFGRRPRTPIDARRRD
jgi:signal transduction histidine kinase/ligand-binding sensor domain-containing protein